VRLRDLEHILRAAATICDDDEIIVVGSQSILGQFPDAPEELCVSNEADIYPKNKPELADLIDGTIGELSAFHETFGYYAQGIQAGTATLPRNWEARLVPICSAATRGATGYCLEVHDLLISKYVANREKDRRFVRAAIAHSLVQINIVRMRLGATDVEDVVRRNIEALIAVDAKLVSGR
jgi:hypothetical protein